MRKVTSLRSRLPVLAREDGGQSVIIVALMFTLLMGFAALSVDVGRFYAERRFTQSAVDAASLACAIKYARTGGDAVAAWNAGNDILQSRNLRGNPLGLTLAYAAQGAETYDNNITLPSHLNSGILPVSSPATGCRVAITTAVPTFLVKILSSTLNTIPMTTRGYAKARAGFLPSVVKRYLNPSDTDDIDMGTTNDFVDTTAADGFDSACHAGSNYAPGCVPASLTAKGQNIVLFGASQKATNDSSFRGYIGLDVRNFSDANPPNSTYLLHDSYNLVPPDTTVTVLKDYEGRWIAEGYPGPDICVVDLSTFDKCAQIAAIVGSSSGIFIDWYNQYFRPGDYLMLQLYDGTVKSVPDFTFLPPTLQVPENGAIAPVTIKYSMSSQFAATSSAICSDLVPDNGTVTGGPGDTTGSNPFMTGAVTINSSGPCSGLGVGNFSSNPTPASATSYDQIWSGMTASSAKQGIYQAFVRGRASAPYQDRIHAFPVKVVVDGQTTEYRISSSETLKSISTSALPATVSWNIVIASGSGPSKWQTTGSNLDGPVTVSWESCLKSEDLVPAVLTTCYIDTIGTTSKTVTADTTVAVRVQTAGVVTQTTYWGWIRTDARDHDGHPVVKLWRVRLDVDQAVGGTTQYIDVIGYAVFEVTAMDSNDVYGQAVTGTYLDPNHPALAIGKKIMLVPWETP